MQILLNGIIIGGTYALIAVGFSLIYSSVRFHHLAYAAIGLFGAYVNYVFIEYLNISFIFGLILSSLLFGFFGLIVWQYLYRPLREKKASDVAMVVASFGLLLVVQNLMALIFGNTVKYISLTDTIVKGYDIFGLSITFNQIIILVTAAIVVVLFELFINKTKLGKGIQAVGENKELAQVIGIRADRIILITFFLGTVLSVIGTNLISLEIGLKPTYSLILVLKVIIAAIIGTMGSIRGALAGGLILGIAENIGIYYFGGNWQDTVAFSLLILFLLFKPQGLFAKKA